jgi:chromosome segregation ATPase
MNFVLFVLMVVAGGAAYYEYTSEEQTNAGIQQQLGEWQGKVAAAQDQNKALTKDTADLTKAISKAETEEADLTTRLAAAQEAARKAQEAAAKKAASPATASAAAAAQTAANNHLGTINTLIGQTFQNCQLLKVEADGITFSHSQGITKVIYANLPPDLQKRFGYDPHQAAALSEAQIRYQEELRQANDQAQGGTAPVPTPAAGP